VINVLFKRGQSDDEIVDVLVNPNHISAHVLSEPEIRRNTDSQNATGARPGHPKESKEDVAQF